MHTGKCFKLPLIPPYAEIDFNKTQVGTQCGVDFLHFFSSPDRRGPARGFLAKSDIDRMSLYVDGKESMALRQ